MRKFWIRLVVAWLATAGLGEALAQGSAKQAPANTTSSAASAAAVVVPQAETLLALIRTNLLALDHALRTDNFGVLFAISSPFLQTRMAPEQLAAAFRPLRNQSLDLVIAAIKTPNLTEAPVVLPNGMLRLVGKFDTAPRIINFEMLFEPTQGEWRLAGMNLAAVPLPAAAGPAPRAPEFGAKSGASTKK